MARKNEESQQLDIKHAINNIINRLQQLAPTYIGATTRLKTKLSCVFESNMITRFSQLKQVFADNACPKVRTTQRYAYPQLILPR